ncbi:phosphate ABC transporter substrate-binding protein PstS [Acidocella sp.]|uniref:phosphate ABC transporter substrate-binding protein PstS n=1 Tax=Acidocella sp. TaxID=50710 RepID=UPI0026140D32|nr:phosphate ABC transporter substrate-binding protein PstS [Acidocella sp.]
MKLPTLLRTGAAALALATAAGLATPAHAAGISLVETGSSLLYPLFNLWVASYSTAHPDVSITTTSTGSGAGISQSIQGLVQIGASDAYLSDAMVKAHPEMLNIPLGISSQAINYNLPGITHLHLTGPILAGIYEGKITNWNDPAIAAANPGVTLPNHVIIPIHRIDGSGDTFIFSQYLAFSDAGWSSTEHYGTSISWPAVAGGIGANGNPGMVTALKNNPYGIAYIGISFADQVKAAKLGQAELLNKAGNYVLPTPETISAAAASVASTTPADERISMVFAPGANAYPIVNYEYAIVKTSQPDAATAKAIRKFLSWCVQGGNVPAYLDKVHFMALPAAVKTLSVTQIDKIK